MIFVSVPEVTTDTTQSDDPRWEEGKGRVGISLFSNSIIISHLLLVISLVGIKTLYLSLFKDLLPPH